LEGAEESQVTGLKCKKVATRNEERQHLSKKVREKQPGKYYRGTVIKMGGINPCERYVSAGQDCLAHHSR